MTADGGTERRMRRRLCPRPPETQPVILTIKPAQTSVKKKTGGGALRPESFSARAAGSARPGVPGEGSLNREASKGVARAAKVTEGGLSSDTHGMQQISSDVIRLIEGANGKVLSAGPSPDEKQCETVLAEMPAANYPAFLDQLRRLGDLESNGDKEYLPAPDANVRVSVSFDNRD